jgi:hypothetical protein
MLNAPDFDQNLMTQSLDASKFKEEEAKSSVKTFRSVS